MNLTHINIQKLEGIRTLIEGLPVGFFVKQQPLLNNATIGQHIRHILEFYRQLILGAAQKEICYDSRERELRIENDPEYSIKFIYELITAMHQLKEETQLTFKASYSEIEDNKEFIYSSLKRELAYALDHTIHHLAIIKIVLSKENIHTDPTLGVAPSTLRYNHISKN